MLKKSIHITSSLILLLALLLAACGSSDLPSNYQPSPKPAPTNTKQKPKPPPTATSKPPSINSDHIGITDEITGGGKIDTPGASLTVQNQTTDVICDLYIWPYDTAFTNQNLLGDGRLNPGQNYMTEGPSGFYHLRVVNCDGYEIRRDANLMGPMIWKLYYFPK